MKFTITCCYKVIHHQFISLFMIMSFNLGNWAHRTEKETTTYTNTYSKHT